MWLLEYEAYTLIRFGGIRVAYVFKLNKSVPGDCKKYIELMTIYNTLVRYDGQIFNSLDDFYLNAGRGAILALRKLPSVVSQRFISNTFSVMKQDDSPDKLVGFVSSISACNFGVLELMAKKQTQTKK